MSVGQKNVLVNWTDLSNHFVLTIPNLGQYCDSEQIKCGIFILYLAWTRFVYKWR